MRKNGIRNNNKGFTLVEMIIVLVILAILAAILIPTLLGYIDESKEKQYLLNAKNCLNAAQAELTKLYAAKDKIPDEGYDVITGKKSTAKNGDTDLTGTDFAKRVLELADADPYCFMIATGSNFTGTKDKCTEHDKYTVIFAYYVEELTATQWFYYNGEWSKLAPRDKNKNGYANADNYILSGNLKGKRLQYFLVSNKSKTTFANLWPWIKHEKDKPDKP